MRTLILLLLVNASLAACQAQEIWQHRDYPGLDYFTLARDLDQNVGGIQQLLEISPAQLVAIEAIPFSEIASAKSRELMREEARDRARNRANGIPSTKEKPRPTFNNSRRALYWFTPNDLEVACDDVIKSELVKILEESQLASMRSVQLQIWYPRGYSAFEEPDIFYFFDIPDEVRNRVTAKVTEERKTSEQRIVKLNEEFAQKVVDALPEQSKSKLVRAIGNHFLPSFSSNSDPEFSVMPFLKSTFTFPNLEAMLASPDELKRVGVTPTQVATIQAAVAKAEELNRVFFDVANANKVDPKRSYGEEMASQLRTALTTLTPQQLILLAQGVGLREFKADFSAPFERDKFVEFLGLSPQETTAIQVVAKKTKMEYEQRVKEADKAIFDRLSDLLPEKQRSGIRKFFEGVY